MFYAIKIEKLFSQGSVYTQVVGSSSLSPSKILVFFTIKKRFFRHEYPVTILQTDFGNRETVVSQSIF